LTVAYFVKTNNITLKASTGMCGKVSVTTIEIICHIQCLKRLHFVAPEISLFTARRNVREMDASHIGFYLLNALLTPKIHSW
jgi:hypothetical protein